MRAGLLRPLTAVALLVLAVGEDATTSQTTQAPAKPVAEPVAAAVKDDIDPAGACKDEIKSFCAHTPPRAHGRYAACLRGKRAGARLRKERNPLTPECTAGLQAFFQRVSRQWTKPVSNFSALINPVKGFKQACKKDMEQFCADPGRQGLTVCLKVNKPKLSDMCKEKLFQVEELEAEDIRLDAALSEACKAEINQTAGICAVTSPPGAQIACLRANRKGLQAPCRQALFVRDKEDSADIRLNIDVMTSCQAEITSKCKDIEFGEARMLNCLWEQMHVPSIDGFSDTCREKVVKLTEQHLRDYRLDFRVRTYCKNDIDQRCPEAKASVDKLTIVQLFGGVDMDGMHHEGDSGAVLHCLKNNLDVVKEARCKTEILRMVKIEAAQFGTDAKLLAACRTDVSSRCGDQRRKSIHYCLRNNINKVSPACRQQELLQGSLESSNVALKPQIFYTCRFAMDKFCRNVAPGAAQMLKCLQDHHAKDDFPARCKKAIAEDLQASNHDYRFKFGFSDHCKAAIGKFCADVMEEGGGKVTSCLQNHISNLTDPTCKREVRRFVSQGFENINFTPVLKDKCKGDISSFCSHVEAGNSMVLKCLMGHRQQLSTECASGLFDKVSLEFQDIRMNSKNVEICQTSIDKFCKDVKPGSGYVWRCLENNIEKEDMTKECRTLVQKMMKLRNANYNLNPHLSKDCFREAHQLCPKEFAQAAFKTFSTNGSLITCMIRNRAKIQSMDCKNSLFRKEQQRVQNTELDPEVKQVCGAESEKLCNRPQDKANGKMMCMLGAMKTLSKPCADKVEEYVVLSTEDIRFKSRLVQNCQAPIKKFCTALETTAQISCLLNHMYDTEVDSSCRNLLVGEEMWQAKGMKYNPRLKAKCKDDLLALLRDNRCPATATNQGYKFKCLMQHQQAIKNPECKAALMGSLARMSADVRAVPGMMTACKADMAELCPSIEPGAARMHTCLRDNRGNIRNRRCLELVQDMFKLDSTSASTSYNIRKECANERRRFCQDVQAGDSNVLACLAGHMKEQVFSTGCMNELKKADVRGALMKHPIQKGIQELQAFYNEHRGFFDKYGVLLLGGTIGFVVIMGCVVSYLVIQQKMWSGFGFYSSVVTPQDLEAES